MGSSAHVSRHAGLDASGTHDACQLYMYNAVEFFLSFLLNPDLLSGTERRNAKKRKQMKGKVTFFHQKEEGKNDY